MNKFTSGELLDSLKEKTGARSDYALAKSVLKINPESLYQMRERGLSDDRAVQVAEMLGLDSGAVLAGVHAERAKSPAVRKAWEKLAATLRSGAAAAVFLFAVGIGGGLTAASNFQGCILCQVRRYARVLAFLPLFFAGYASAADPWSHGDVTRETVYQVLAVVDWGQTLDIENHPGMSESNPILGRHPSRARINSYFLTAGILHAVAVHYLPAPWRPAFQAVSIGIEVDAVAHNARLGIGLAF